MFLASIAFHRCDRTVFLAGSLSEHVGLAETSPEGKSIVLLVGNWSNCKSTGGLSWNRSQG